MTADDDFRAAHSRLRETPRKNVADAAVKSAARVLEIFELFCERREPLSVGEVATSLGYPQSSTSMLMHSLQSLGYLSFDAQNRCFAPTVRLAVLGGWINDLISQSGSLTQMMEDIRHKTGETVVLGIQNTTYVQYAQVLPGYAQPKEFLRIGQMRPIGIAALGKMLLSLKPDDEIAQLVRTMNGSLPEGERQVNIAHLLVEIAQIRRQGYARSRGTVVPGRDIIAVRMNRRMGGDHIVLGISGETASHDADLGNLLAVLRDAAGLPPDIEVPGVPDAAPIVVKRNCWHPQ